MVFLRQQKSLSSSSSESTFPVPPSKIPKSVDSEIEKMVSILADASCTLIEDHHVSLLILASSVATSPFSSLTTPRFAPISLTASLLMFSLPKISSGSELIESWQKRSLVRQLLLVPCFQLDLMNMLLEKLPEYFDVNPETQTSLSLEENVGRLIINQFRWLDFLVDPKSFTGKLMEVLCICPLHLKKEIIGSLPEIIGDQRNNKSVINSHSAIIVPVLDSFWNLNLDDKS